MSDAILVAIITGGLSLLGIIYSSGKSASKVDAKLDKQQAVIETKLNELTREVREHNNFARRVPVVEEGHQPPYRGLGGLSQACMTRK